MNRKQMMPDISEIEVPNLGILEHEMINMI